LKGMMNMPEKKFTFYLILTAILFFAAHAFIPTDKVTFTTENSQRHYDTITVLNPIITDFIFWFSAACFFLLLIAGGRKSGSKRTPMATVCLIIALVGFPLSCGKARLSNIAPWEIKSELTDKTGDSYYFMNSSFMQGQTMAITRGIKETMFARDMKFIGTNNGDSPRSWASVIRPAGRLEDGYGQLYMTEKGLLAGVRFDNKCYLAYNTVSGRFYGHGDVGTLSPFILIGPSDSLYKPDVDAVISMAKKRVKILLNSTGAVTASALMKGEEGPGYPSLETLKAALDHENGEVKKLAEKLLDINEDLIEIALKKASVQVKEIMEKLQSDDINIQKKAMYDLGDIGGAVSAPAIPFLEKLMISGDKSINQLAAQTLGLIGEKAVPELVRLTKVESSDVVYLAVWGLGMARGNAAKALPDIVPLIDSDDREIRAIACVAIGNIGLPESSAVSGLKKALLDEDRYVRKCAKRALSQLLSKNIQGYQ